MRLDLAQNSILLRHDVGAESLEDLVAVERAEDFLVERRESGALRLSGSAAGLLRSFCTDLFLVGPLTLSSATGSSLTAILNVRLNFTSYVIILTTFVQIFCVVQKNLESLVDRVGFLFPAERQLIAVEVQRGRSAAKITAKSHILKIEVHAGGFEVLGPFGEVAFFWDWNIQHAKFVCKKASNFS